MVKDKIIELENGINYYVIEEIDHNDKKYVLAAMCDLEKEEVNEEDYIVMEIKIEDDLDDILYSKPVALVKKLKRNKGDINEIITSYMLCTM